MIDKNTILPFHFYTYSKPFTGSMNNMRFRIVRQKDEESGAEECFLVSFWPEPFAYDKTDQTLIVDRRFPFTEEGYEQVIAYLNEHLVSEG
ncbi:MAG: hypothetical protein IJU25_06150 [Lachnospiraceae bacterium]|nr:hypothetical protein [Lachnospiraceae bacterium]